VRCRYDERHRIRATCKDLVRGGCLRATRSARNTSGKKRRRRPPRAEAEAWSIRMEGYGAPRASRFRPLVNASAAAWAGSRSNTAGYETKVSTCSDALRRRPQGPVSKSRSCRTWDTRGGPKPSEGSPNGKMSPQVPDQRALRSGLARSRTNGTFTIRYRIAVSDQKCPKCRGYHREMSPSNLPKEGAPGIGGPSSRRHHSDHPACEADTGCDGENHESHHVGTSGCFRAIRYVRGCKDGSS
jgi:hypothetical protein